jgi:hypothetical protein
MDKQYIAERCNEALMENEDYVMMDQSEDMDPIELQARAEEICYRKGFLDAMALVYGNQ